MLALCLVSSLLTAPSHAPIKGMIIKASPHSAAATLDRLEKGLKAKGIHVFARVSHKKNAASVNMSIRPTELLIFGAPKLGTHFFIANQTAGIDLPMKAIAWQDKSGQIWLGYNDPAYVADRHGINGHKGISKIIKKMQGALGKFTDAAVAAGG